MMSTPRSDSELEQLYRRVIADPQSATRAEHKGWDEWEAAERLRAGTPWAGAMLRNGLVYGGASWGFVVFRTGSYGGGPAADEPWRRFREYFDSAADAIILHYNSGPLLWPKFRAVFVERAELEGASDEELRDEFRRMRRGAGGAGAQELPKGMRTSCFLVADRSAIECEAVKTGFIVRHDKGQAPSVNFRPDDPVAYVRAVDPDFRQRRGQGIQGPAPDRGGKVIGVQGAASGKEDAMAGFSGAVKVALPRVFDWLHFVCLHAERGAAWEGRPGAHGWPEIYQQTKEPEVWVRNWAANSGSIHYTTRSYLTWQRMQS